MELTGEFYAPALTEQILVCLTRIEGWVSPHLI
jgi:hypothetical protein